MSGTCGRAGNFTQYPEADAVIREQLINSLLPQCQRISRTVVLNHMSQSPRGLVKNKLQNSIPSISDFVGLE